METIYQIQNLTQNAIISQVTAKACDNKIHMGECRSFVVVKKHIACIPSPPETMVIGQHSFTWNNDRKLQLFGCTVPSEEINQLPSHPGDITLTFISSRWQHFHFHFIQVATVSFSSDPADITERFYQSCLPLILIAADHSTRYKFQNYLPSILIVAVSWVSFWMDIESVPGRCFPNHPKQTTGKSAID